MENGFGTMEEEKENSLKDNLRIFAIGSLVCAVALSVGYIHFRLIRPWYTKRPTLSKGLTVAGQAVSLLGDGR